VKNKKNHMKVIRWMSFICLGHFQKIKKFWWTFVAPLVNFGKYGGSIKCVSLYNSTNFLGCKWKNKKISIISNDMLRKIPIKRNKAVPYSCKTRKFHVALVMIIIILD
jgi:hypothetical protein